MIRPENFTFLSEHFQECISRLSHHLDSAEHDTLNLSRFSSSKLAAVLVLLYEQDGVMRVLLTTRSKALRTHSGQTALPGGRKDDEDRSLVATALREAFEEVALPMDSPDIQILGSLEPLVSLHRLFVTPVIGVLTNPKVLDSLKASESEVDRIFSHPLAALLDPKLALSEPLVAIGSEDWLYETELHNTSDNLVPMHGNTHYRMHRFRSIASPIKGLTSDILIRVAEIAFGHTTVYDRFAPDQLQTSKEIIDAVLAYESASTSIPHAST